MPLPSGGNSPPISIADLNAEFGYGNNLAAYQGKVIGTPNKGVKSIASGAEIKLSDFYSTNKVVGGSITLTSGTSYTVEQYKTIRVTVTAAGGGGAGGKGSSDGFCASNNGFDGVLAGNTRLGSSGDAWYNLCQGGGGGSGAGGAGTTYNGNAGNGANGGAAGNAYGAGPTGGAGGSGAKNVVGYLNNPVLTGGTGPTSGNSVGMSIGGAGGPGGGSSGRIYSPYIFACVDSGLNGSPGSAGGAASILIEWTGEP
jgi:hypothetical protein